MKPRFLAACAIGVALFSACAREQSAPAPAAAYQLPQPNVAMNANPPPPFTYWAPEGAVITNHPHVPGIWFADLDGRRVATYFGDACHASQHQHHVGQPLASAPAPAGMDVRTSCTTCPVNADLRRDRMNVLFNEATQVIEQIACY